MANKTCHLCGFEDMGDIEDWNGGPVVKDVRLGPGLGGTVLYAICLSCIFNLYLEGKNGRGEDDLRHIAQEIDEVMSR